MIRIIIVDDQNFTRKALRAILKNESNLMIVGEAENGIKALELINQELVELAIIDLDMPEMNGFELTEKISQYFPNTKVIILSACDDRDSIIKAVNLGARGYLLKDTSAREVIDTINYVQRGYFQLGPGLFEKLISQSANYELETAGHFSELETKYKQTFVRLKKEIINHNKQVRQEVFEVQDLKIDGLKFELKQGLHKFQGQVYKQLQNGFNNLDHKSHLALDKINKEILIWRYCMIFLLIVFLIEKTAIFLR